MRRVILLGASNITINFPLIVHTLRSALGPVELLAAHGHGRSYGITSRVLVRTLPGIRRCGLWDALDESERSSEKPLALITDVGNDVLFGASVEQILSWVGECLDRLGKLDATTVVTALPVESVRSLGRLRFGLTRSLFFPGRGPHWADVQRIVPELGSGLRDVAEQHRAVVVSPRPEWYGFDPIHIRRRQRAAAWREIFCGWPEFVLPTDPQRRRLTESLRIWRARPASRTLFGRRQETPQPALTLDDGTTVSVF